MFIPPEMMHYLRNTLISKVIKIGKELGVGCDHWFDQEIYDSITDINPDKEEELRERYRNICFEPNVIFKPNLDPIIVTCRPCKVCSGETCNRVFPEISNILLNDIKTHKLDIGIKL